MLNTLLVTSMEERTSDAQQLKELLDEDGIQTQQHIALNVSQETISRHLREMGTINKLGR